MLDALRIVGEARIGDQFGPADRAAVRGIKRIGGACQRHPAVILGAIDGRRRRISIGVADAVPHDAELIELDRQHIEQAEGGFGHR